MKTTNENRIERALQTAIDRTMERVRHDPKITKMIIQQRIRDMSDQEIIEKFIYDYEDIQTNTYKDAIGRAFEKTGTPSKAGTLLSTAMFFRWADTTYGNGYLNEEEFQTAKEQVKLTARILARYIDTRPLREYELNKLEN